jgi:hypothetical protein
VPFGLSIGEKRKVEKEVSFLDLVRFLCSNNVRLSRREAPKINQIKVKKLCSKELNLG